MIQNVNFFSYKNPLHGRIMTTAGIVLLALSAIVTIGHMTNAFNFLSGDGVKYLALSGGIALALSILQGQRVVLGILAIAAIVAGLFALIVCPAKLLLISASVTFSASLFLLFAHRTHSKESFMESLLTCEKIEVAEPYLLATLHDWISKENDTSPKWRTFLETINKKQVFIVSKNLKLELNCELELERLDGKGKLDIVVEPYQEDKHREGFLQAHLESFGSRDIYADPKDVLCCFSNGTKTIGGFYYRIKNDCVYIHTLSRFAHATKSKVVGKMVDYLKKHFPKAKKLCLGVVTDNPAKKVYESVGFNPVKWHCGSESYYDMELTLPTSPLPQP